MKFTKNKNTFQNWVLPISLILGLLILATSLYLLTESTRSGSRFQEWREAIYIVNVIGVAILLVLVFINFWGLYNQYRNAVPGTRFTLSLLRLILPLVLIPLALMFYFSNTFSNDAVDSWFNNEVEQGLQKAYDLSDSSLQGVQERYLVETRDLSSTLWGLYGDELNQQINSYRQRTNAKQITVFDTQGRIYANSVNDLEIEFPQLPEREILFQVQQGSQGYIAIKEDNDGRLFLRSIVTVPRVQQLEAKRLLQADYELSDEVITLAENAKNLYRSYTRLTNYRTPLKRTFTLSLGIAFLAAMLGVVWAAIGLSRRIVRPMQRLAEGTRQVADGDFSQKLDEGRNDEVGFLTSSFNRMTERLQIANDVAASSQQLVEKERSNLASILAGLSSGVLNFDNEFRLRRYNEAAENILGASLYHLVDEEMQTLASQHGHGLNLFSDFIEDCWRRIDQGIFEWRDEIAVSTKDRGRRVFVVACSATQEENQQQSLVIVFDEITRLLRAQRDAAWGEVARRLAHEIKNPLTPIQLSAERLEYRCADKLPHQEREILQQSTRTIIAQVDAMKTMVNAFRDYAQAPELEIKEFILTDLLEEIVTLYRPRNNKIELFTNYQLRDESSYKLEADINRLRQVMHNLFKNAYDALTGALESQQIIRGEIFLTTERIEQVDNTNLQNNNYEFVKLTLIDNAGGFSEEILNSLFEPYVTTKAKGTGLGLAIVRKIIEEHIGDIELSNHQFDEGHIGAKISILLPMNERARLYRLTQGQVIGSLLEQSERAEQTDKQMNLIK